MRFTSTSTELFFRRALLVGALFFFAAPALLIIARAAPQLSSLLTGHSAMGVLSDQLKSSLLTVAGGIAVAFAIGLPPALLTHFYDFHGRALLSFLQLLPLAFSASDLASIYLELSSSVFFESRWALAGELGLAGSPLVYLVFRAALSQIPTAYAEAASTLGARWPKRFSRIYVPLLTGPALIASALVGIDAFSDFAAASRLGIPTLSVGLQQQWFAGASREIANAIAVLMILTVVVLLAAPVLILSRRRIAGAASFQPKDVRREKLRGAKSYGAALSCLVSAAPGFFIPFAISAGWLSNRFGKLDFSSLGADALSTAMIAVSVAALCAAVSILLASLCDVASRTGRHSIWLLALCLIPPPLLFATNFLSMALLQDSVAAVLLAQTFRFLPLTAFLVVEALFRVPLALPQSARTLGATRARAFLRTTLPQLFPALAAGWLLIGFIVSLYPVWVLSGLLDTRKGSDA